jgi:DNA-binding NtrC family response regulator
VLKRELERELASDVIRHVNEKPQNEVETILIVEDEVLIRMSIAQYLRDCGFKVIEAANADEAMAVLQHIETHIDVVFSDIDMPGSVDGFGLSRWIKERRRAIDVILTGTVPRAVNAAAELCESGPLPKPYEPQAVHDHIRRLLATRKAGRGGGG